MTNGGKTKKGLLSNMMRLLISFLLLCLSGCFRDIVVERPVDRDDVAENFSLVMRGVAALLDDTGDSFCTGAFYRGYVITAEHCVTGRDHVNIGFYDDFDYELDRWSDWELYEVRQKDSEGDVALLRAVLPQTTRHLNLRLASEGPVLASRVFVIGHPLGLPYSVSEGRVVATRRYYEPSKMLWTQISAPVHPGNSGGPVLNDDGELIGIVSFMWMGKHNLAGAAHLDSVEILLRRENVPTHGH